MDAEDTPPTPPDQEKIPPPYQHRRGRVAARFKRRVYAMWGRTCHLCGHGGADSVDHLIPLSVWPDQPLDATLARPAHGVDGCPTCGVKCNQVRGASLLKPAYEGPLQW